MSIIVKGMQMPENCTRCDYIGLNVAIGCPVMSGTNGRATDCPLGALPDKHGRLVDADAMRDRLRNLADDDWNANTTTTWSEAFSECADMVDEQPTIEPERKKGKWIPDNNSVYEMRFVCSECKTSEIVPTIGFTKYKPIWDFRPNCGADMREPEDIPMEYFESGGR